MKAFLVQNRSMTPDSDGFIHLVPVGEFPAVITVEGKDKDIEMVLDDAAHDAIMKTYARDSAAPNWTGYLVDKEHFSHDLTKSSEANAWIKVLQRRADGIWGLPEWTALGRGLIEGKLYKHLSPVLLLQPLAANRGRAFAFTDAGLTNKPRLKTLVPIQCRDGQTQEEARMKKLCELLKLPVDVPEETLLQNVLQVINRAGEADALKVRAETAERERDELKTVSLNRDADAFVVKHNDRITDPVKVKALFVANRQTAEEFVALLRPMPAAAQQALNRGDGKTPTGSSVAVENPDLVLNRRREQLEFVETVRVRNRLPSVAAAWPVAQAIKPELFKD